MFQSLEIFRKQRGSETEEKEMLHRLRGEGRPCHGPKYNYLLLSFQFLSVSLITLGLPFLHKKFL